MDPGHRARADSSIPWADQGGEMKFRRGASAEPDPPAQPKASLAEAVRPAVETHTEADASAVAAQSGHVPLFGARAQARTLAVQLAELQERADRLGLLSVIELEERNASLAAQAAELESRIEADGREASARVEKEAESARERARARITMLTTRQNELEAEVAKLKQDVAVTEETAILQEVGIYEYRHPLTDAVAYQAALKRLQDQIKVMARKDGGAVLAATNWTVNGSSAQGKTMVREYSKLVLRAYNAEADNLVRGLKPYKLESALERLARISVTIARLGKTMDIRISDQYRVLRILEIELTADYLEKRAEEKAREAAERERLREEKRVQQQLAQERARLEKEHQHYTNVINRLIEQGKLQAAEDHRQTLVQIEKAIEDVDYRVANVRAGYVYVISNVGAFGEQMVKIGLTRRIDPTERVRELGDASVPFRYDTHALFFSDDAVGLEAKMHDRLADRRVNWVNRRREFFYVSPAEAKQHLLELTGDLLEYIEEPEALEYRQSINHARTTTSALGDPESPSKIAEPAAPPEIVIPPNHRGPLHDAPEAEPIVA
jgi:Domain of unknown function (DUF4041)/T5orf172 domain